MKCKKCGQKIDEKITVPLKVGCSVTASCLIAHPCTNCGLLHLADGSLVTNSSHKKVFYKNNKIIIQES
jgi:hypothetical protein